MDSRINEIITGLQRLLKTVENSFIAKVIEDKSDTVDVEDMNGTKYTDVRKIATQGTQGILFKLKKDSFVIVGRISGSDELFVVMMSEIEKVEIKVDDTADIEIGGDIAIKAKSNIDVSSDKDIDVNSNKATIKTKSGDVAIESGAKLSFKNKAASLGDVVSGLIQELLSTTVVTPAGPGNINPANIANFTQLLIKSKSLLS